MIEPFCPESQQIAALARWLKEPEIVRQLGAMMPLCGGPRTACEQRVLDVANALLKAQL